MDTMMKNNHSNSRLIIFTRYPEPGKAKTRLIPVLGKKGAAELSKEMTEYTLTCARRVKEKNRAAIEVRYAGGTEKSMSAWLGEDILCAPQGNGDLGERMRGAFKEAFDRGSRKVIIVGTDCPDMTAERVEDAFEKLKRCDVVLGPANDGGYYLIGLKKEIPELFFNVSWGTGAVFSRTKEIARALKLSVFLLEPLSDIDRPEDVPLISVIIPALNEEEKIAPTLKSLKDVLRTEVIVVDGGSADKTTEMARSYGANVLTSMSGRARQLNVGAARAKGEILLFLHADTRLPKNFDMEIRKALLPKETVGGAFEIYVDAPLLLLRAFEKITNWRARRTQTAFGDQCIFVRRIIFHALGGFPDIPIMEDYAFVKQLRLQGEFVILHKKVITSARRFLSQGLIKTALKNRVAIIAYHLGVSPEHIARWYHGKDKGTKERNKTPYLPVPARQTGPIPIGVKGES